MKAKSQIHNSIKSRKIKKVTSKLTCQIKLESSEIMKALINLSKGNPLEQDKKDTTIIQ